MMKYRVELGNYYTKQHVAAMEHLLSVLCVSLELVLDEIVGKVYEIELDETDAIILQALSNADCLIAEEIND